MDSSAQLVAEAAPSFSS